jgi:tetratricopeptide (TPR) repeat protein
LTLFRAGPYLRRFHRWTVKSAYIAVLRVFHVTQQLEHEIRTLRSLFWSDRDPEGLAFAPLADAYRRAGQFRQAVELLANGRVRHPDFATGHVVAARLFMEKGLLEEGELAARRALALDEDNILALGLLADALEAKGGALDAQSLRARVSEMTSGDASPGAEEPVVGIAELAPDEPVDAEEPVVDIAELAPDEPSEADEPVVDIAELAPDEPLHAEVPVVDIADLTTDEPLHAEVPVVDIADLTTDEPSEADELEEDSDFKDDGMLVTRTLADLYARQGFTAEALEVYHQLLQIDPRDEELRRKVEALESGPEGQVGAAAPGAEDLSEPVALDDDEPMEHVWQTQAHAEGHDVDTPFAWISEEPAEAAAAAPPISEYFRRLLAWEPGASNAEGATGDRGRSPGSDDGGDDLTTRMNEEGE